MAVVPADVYGGPVTLIPMQLCSLHDAEDTTQEDRNKRLSARTIQAPDARAECWLSSSAVRLLLHQSS